MSVRTNRRTRQRFYIRPFAHEIGQPDCICHGECIGQKDPGNCPFRGFKTLGGYCRTCYRGLHGKVSDLSSREQRFRKMSLAEREYGKTLVTQMGKEIRCEYCGRTRDKCECVVGGMK
jgi:hypothetical protein